jgi:SAM-dependent methyltransferase
MDRVEASLKLDFERAARLRAAVRGACSAAAAAPKGTHPFPVGRSFAESLGYSADELAALPAAAVDAFTGVSNVSVFADLQPGVHVLDVGCGAGLDSLIAATRVGQSGRVAGVDFSADMLRRARQAAAQAAATNLAFCQADAESLPLKSGTIDVALVNGIFNLNPAREAVFAELARVVHAGGSVYAAELVLRESSRAPEACTIDDNWFA